MNRLTHRTPNQIIARDLVQARTEAFYGQQDLANGHPPPAGFHARLLGSCLLSATVSPELAQIAARLQARPLDEWTASDLDAVVAQMDKALAILGIGA